ncbi:Wzy polymerase domain-containing protein [Klebsiella variicola]|uniref:PglL family O-oligosaccharyltransferase n=1 Tax=Klebsiella variicola TaxID=244366 RepID=UPI000D750C98|nr:O-antigen ligase family protein [Klebsiella variicola]EIY5101902.1 O-antigen ligase C-terminal domain-containing protein [Klebsiella variicola]EKW2092622.1 O-antigen ligase C-terminal domain-containing protein [Klebsiella variicola]PXL03273.1 hypothetical protein DMS22_21270 [Klebsiella variicola]PZZ92565.1 hypothetical protein DMS93_10885 [Klebsiella variicola]
MNIVKENSPGTMVCVLIIGIWLGLIMHIPFYNLGGSGFTLPQNIMTWIVVAVLCCSILIFNSGKRIIVTPLLSILIAAAVFMTIPLLWSESSIATGSAAARYCGLWGGVIFYFCLLQVSFTEKTKSTILWLIVLSATVECSVVLQTLFLPGTLSTTTLRLYMDNGRGALGTFQQVNVTSSWLATGLAAQMTLLCTGIPAPNTTKRNQRSNAIKMAVSTIILVTLYACIILTRSRTGWLGGILCYLMFCLVQPVLFKNRHISSLNVFILLLAPPAGIVTGLMLLDCTMVQAISHTASNHQRLLTLKETWQMIMLHPFKGWGPGAFRTAFQTFMASHFANNPSHELMGHPHNELFYVWFEGGIIALMGYLLLLLAIGWLILCRTDIQRRMMGIIILPIMLHTWTEFPFYYSAVHFVVLLILVALIDLSGRPDDIGVAISDRVRSAFIFTRFAMVFMSICVVLWLFKAFITESVLCHFEDGTLDEPDRIARITPPPLTAERYSHDLNLLNLVHYYSTGDKKLLRSYLRINSQWLLQHPEPDDYDNQIKVLRVIGQTEDAEKYRISANHLFPWDPRFSGEDSTE